MNRQRVAKVGDRWLNVTGILKGEFEKSGRRRIPHSELSDQVADFLESEKLIPIMIRRVQRRGRLL